MFCCLYERIQARLGPKRGFLTLSNDVGRQMVSSEGRLICIDGPDDVACWVSSELALATRNMQCPRIGCQLSETRVSSSDVGSQDLLWALLPAHLDPLARHHWQVLERYARECFYLDSGVMHRPADALDAGAQASDWPRGRAVRGRGVEAFELAGWCFKDQFHLEVAPDCAFNLMGSPRRSSSETTSPPSNGCKRRARLSNDMGVCPAYATSAQCSESSRLPGPRLCLRRPPGCSGRRAPAAR